MADNPDHVISTLEEELEDLAALWRGTHSDDAIQAYHETMKRLYELGWDGRLSVQSLLPAANMPEEYIRRNGLY